MTNLLNFFANFFYLKFYFFIIFVILYKEKTGQIKETPLFVIISFISIFQRDCILGSVHEKKEVVLRWRSKRWQHTHWRTDSLDLQHLSTWNNTLLILTMVIFLAKEMVQWPITHQLFMFCMKNIQKSKIGLKRRQNIFDEHPLKNWDCLFWFFDVFSYNVLSTSYSINLSVEFVLTF